jgi:primosomal protein N' (replication factor Y)
VSPVRAPGARAPEVVAFAQVAIPLPVEGLYTYRIPPGLAPAITVGSRVAVRFGRRSARGVVVEIAGEPPDPGRTLRDIEAACDPMPLLTPDLIELGRWIAGHYICSLGEALDAMAPSPTGAERLDRFVRIPGGEAAVASLPARARRARELARAILAHASHAGLARAGESGALAGVPVAEVRALAAGADRALAALRRAGVVQVIEAAPAPPEARGGASGAVPVLTPDQARCAGAIACALDAGRSEVHLVHGITGSGKTEIYLDIIRRCRDRERGAVFLLPEISLTVPMIDLLRERFGSDVALLHSALSPSQRYREWLAVARGAKRIVVGARSAVFAPLARPAVFVIDEESEGSYKQEGKPCYHARDVARWRAARSGACVVLGSATPSLESYHEAVTGRIGYHRLTARINGQPLPEVRLVDMGREFAEKKNRSIFSMDLKGELDRVLGDGGQALLFLNRRGHSTYVFCRACGKAVECRDCTIALTYHMATGRMLCHLCGYGAEPPRTCPACGDTSVRYCGGGTQRVEEEFRANFPGVEAARMDSDTTARRGAHERILGAYRDGRTRVLIGTQMVAKGFDFPNLDLVGVVNADSVLHMSDFRSAERTFQLVTQVAGRVGRGSKPGTVLVQTYSPTHYALGSARLHDFEQFASLELPHREALHYPPFSRLIQVTAEAADEAGPRALLARIRDRLAEGPARGAGVRILGPAPARVPRVAGRHRFCLLIKLPVDGPVAPAVKDALRETAAPSGVSLRFDVDP